MFIFCFVSCVTTKDISHPVTYNIDIYDYTKDFVLSPNKENSNHSYELNKIKIKDAELLSGDRLSVYLSFSSKKRITSLNCEVFDGDGTLIGEKEMSNEAPNKKFLSSATFNLKKDLVNPLTIRFTTEEGNLKKKYAGELVDLKIEKIGDQSYKKYKKNQLPRYIESIEEENEEKASSWYISKVMENQKAGAKIFGPFETKEQALAVWIFKNYKEKGYKCISKNYTYVTNDPEKYFKEYNSVYNYFETNGAEMALEYYFLGEE